MNNQNEKAGFISQIVASGRIVLFTMAICCLLYSMVVLVVGKMLTPSTANGSLVLNEQGVIIGSELLAQGFSRPEYFWPRPSSVDYNASAAGGSNLSPANPELCSRAKSIITKMGVTREKKIPADLVTASGSGLDPHISLIAAKYQAERVAAARGLSITSIIGLLEKYAKHPGGKFTPEPVVNVLLVNMALNSLEK